MARAATVFVHPTHSKDVYPEISGNLTAMTLNEQLASKDVGEPSPCATNRLREARGYGQEAHWPAFVPGPLLPPRSTHAQSAKSDPRWKGNGHEAQTNGPSTVHFPRRELLLQAAACRLVYVKGTRGVLTCDDIVWNARCDTAGERKTLGLALTCTNRPKKRKSAARASAWRGD